MEDSEFGCALCMFRSPDSGSLRKHIQDCHPREFGHYCKECGRCFCTSELLIKHLTSECDKNNIFVFRCAVTECNYACRKPMEFSSHIKMTHRGKPLMSCIYCSQYFTIPFCLIQHIQEQCINRPKDWHKEEETLINSNMLSKQTANATPTASTNTPVSRLVKPPFIISASADKPKVVEATASILKPQTKVNRAAALYDNSSGSDVDDPSWDDDDDEEVITPHPVKRRKKVADVPVRKMPERTNRGKHMYRDMDNDEENQVNRDRSRASTNSPAKKKTLTSFEDTIKVEVPDNNETTVDSAGLGSEVKIKVEVEDDDDVVDQSDGTLTAAASAEGVPYNLRDAISDVKLTSMKARVMLERKTY